MVPGHWVLEGEDWSLVDIPGKTASRQARKRSPIASGSRGLCHPGQLLCGRLKDNSRKDEALVFSKASWLRVPVTPVWFCSSSN